MRAKSWHISHPHKVIQALTAIIIFIPCCAFALKSDSDKPYYIRSNSVIYDRNKNTAIYIGNVHIRQGTTRLSGDKVVIFLSKHNQVKRLLAYGQLAHYSTLPNQKKKRFNAQAEKIDYNPIKKTVLLLKNGKVTQDNNIFTGPYIWYDIGHGIVKSKPSKQQYHTVIVIQPQKKTSQNS